MMICINEGSGVARGVHGDPGDAAQCSRKPEFLGRNGKNMGNGTQDSSKYVELTGTLFFGLFGFVWALADSPLLLFRVIVFFL
jgi:hypothetical protein